MPASVALAKCQSKGGSALISALFIMTLVAIAATAMSTRLQLDIYRTRLTIARDELYLASQAVTFWAMDTLSVVNKRFIVKGKNRTLASFPSPLQHVYPEVTVTGDLYDLQALFNLNNLRNKKFQPLFFRLLENTLTTSDNTQRKSLMSALIYWITPYQPGHGHDVYLSFYTKQRPPYLPGFQPMQSISELRLVYGVSYEIYQALLPSVTVLPEETPININTAPKALLMSLGNGLNQTEVDELLQARGKKGITDVRKLYQLLQKLDIPFDQITIESTYYLCVSKATSLDLTLTTYTVIKRSKDRQGNLSVSLVRESLNTI